MSAVSGQFQHKTPKSAFLSRMGFYSLNYTTMFSHQKDRFDKLVAFSKKLECEPKFKDEDEFKEIKLIKVESDPTYEALIKQTRTHALFVRREKKVFDSILSKVATFEDNDDLSRSIIELMDILNYTNSFDGSGELKADFEKATLVKSIRQSVVAAKDRLHDLPAKPKPGCLYALFAALKIAEFELKGIAFKVDKPSLITKHQVKVSAFNGNTTALKCSLHRVLRDLIEALDVGLKRDSLNLLRIEQFQFAVQSILDACEGSSYQELHEKRKSFYSQDYVISFIEANANAGFYPIVLSCEPPSSRSTTPVSDASSVSVSSVNSVDQSQFEKNRAKRKKWYELAGESIPSRQPSLEPSLVLGGAAVYEDYCKSSGPSQHRYICT